MTDYIISLINRGVILFVSLMLFSACVQYDAEPFDGRVLPRRSGYVNEVTNDWIYYNLRTGEVFNGDKVNQHIKEGEQKNRLDWDLAFCGFTIRTNSGTSGIGHGGAADLGKGNYEKWQHLSQLPKGLKWVLDNGDVYVTMSKRDWTHKAVKLGKTHIPWFDPNRGPKREKTNANPLLEQALRFSGPPPSYLPSYHTYVIRTADGKHYYKLQIISWFNSDIEIGDSGGRISFYCDELK